MVRPRFFMNKEFNQTNEMRGLGCRQRIDFCRVMWLERSRAGDLVGFLDDFLKMFERGFKVSVVSISLLHFTTIHLTALTFT